MDCLALLPTVVLRAIVDCDIHRTSAHNSATPSLIHGTSRVAGSVRSTVREQFVGSDSQSQALDHCQSSERDESSANGILMNVCDHVVEILRIDDVFIVARPRQPKPPIRPIAVVEL